MQLTPLRTFAVGACSVLVIAAAFTAGIGVASHDRWREQAVAESHVAAAITYREPPPPGLATAPPHSGATPGSPQSM